MENLFFSLNATIPIFLLMVVGYFLNKMNILSFYHKYYEQEQGEELTPTYFHWKKLEKEFHIDYVFGSEKIYKNLQNMEIGQYDNWIDVSDHMPMILNMNAE